MQSHLIQLEQECLFTSIVIYVNYVHKNQFILCAADIRFPFISRQILYRTMDMCV